MLCMLSCCSVGGVWSSSFCVFVLWASECATPVLLFSLLCRTSQHVFHGFLVSLLQVLCVSALASTPL